MDKATSKLLSRKRKAATLNREFYSLRSLLGYDWAIFYFLIGGREAGKSYATTDFFCKQWRKYGRPFYWIRLSETSRDKLLANNADKLIDPDIRRKYQLDLVTSGDRVYEVTKRDAQGKIKEKKIEIEKNYKKLSDAENNYNLEEAAKLRHAIIPNLEKELNELTKNNKSDILSDTIDDESIASIISKWTNIPISKLVGTEREKLLHLEENMKKRVKGQDNALKLVSNAIIRARAGIKDPTKPIGSFIFLGPTGVGKTEVAKTLASELFDSDKHMIRIDMSEYMESFNVSRLIGAPPGYVGYDEGGQLTEAVRRNPYSIVLFDEIEKAHKDVFNILLQILDDGRITDSQGRTVDFKNTIIIMTSNIGSEYILDNNKNSYDLVMKELKNSFKPEFLNRIDEIIMFNSLSKDVVYSILDNILKEIEYRLSDKQLKLNLTDRAKDFIINESYDQNYGARPIRRYVSGTLETLIATNIIAGNIKVGSTINIDVKDEELVLI